MQWTACHKKPQPKPELWGKACDAGGTGQLYRALVLRYTLPYDCYALESGRSPYLEAKDGFRPILLKNSALS
jgi:hypothetical protein